jgi:hypothetical protein
MTEYESHVRETLAATKRELSMSRRTWEVVYGMPHPGPGYFSVLHAQLRRYTQELQDLERKAKR